MNSKLFLVLSALVLSMGATASTQVCFNTPDGTDSNNWSYKDYIIPSGYKIDSVFMNATRNGYPTNQYVFSMSYCPSSTSYSNCTGGKVTLNYQNFTTSMYNVWLRIDTANNIAPGMVRVILPTNAGAAWIQLCFAISSTSCAPNITTGLVANYPFTGNANDVSGNANNGTVSGAMLVADRFGNANSAYSFNGTTDSISIPHSSSLAFATNKISVSYWLKEASYPSTGNSQILISKQSGYGSTQNGFNVYQYDITGQGLYVGSNAAPGGPMISSPPLSQWHQVVLVYDNGNCYGYYDGVLTSSTTTAATLGLNTQKLLIGKANWVFSNTTNYNGILDDIRFYNVAITACDVDSLFNMPNPNTTGVQHQANATAFNVYPNPATEHITIQFSANENKLITTELIDLTGKVIKAERKAFSGTENVLRIDLSDVEPGFYFLKLGNNVQKVQVIK